MTSGSLADLAERIRQLARVPVLLVACDYDGTIAPRTDDPLVARPNRESAAAMRTLAESPRTHVAVISGRSLRDLAALSRLPEAVRLVGSHGSEFDLGFGAELDPELVRRRRAITDAVTELGRRVGAPVEEKPTGVTLHLRGLDPAAAAAARDELIRGPAGWEHIKVRNGSDIIELSVIETNKGRALEAIRHQVNASAVLFLGDDVTDEDAFVTLRGPDVGVKVGGGHTSAAFRVPDAKLVAQLLALLCELRAEWLRGASLVPINHHSVLSDLRTAAVITPDARVSWLCLPRIDSGAVFAELLGGPTAGYFRVGPEGDEQPVDQRYRHRSMVLETRFASITVTDYLDVSDGRTARLAGRSDLVRVVRGTGPVRIEFAPRIDFGRVPSRLELRGDGVAVLGTPDLLVLRAPGVRWQVQHEGVHQSAIGSIDLDGAEVVLELRAGTASVRPERRPEVERRDETERWWAEWATKLTLPSLQPELVERSALLLRALAHGPTGAIVAAATTSLPEHLGGVRNWDHRYCWLRDAALSAAALVRLGSRQEADAYLDWLQRVLEVRGDPERLAPLYNVAGRHLSPEAEIAELPGYGGSRPVRVGNAAEGQVQLDVFGHIVDLVHLLSCSGDPVSPQRWRLVQDLVLAVSRRWRHVDHGMWESRRAPRHHVHSKVMCWVAVDRAIDIARRVVDREPQAWVELRDAIADEVLDRGWNRHRRTFCAAYDDDDLDASVLAIGLTGLLTPSDERFVSTVAAIESELRRGSTVDRYHGDDGLPGRDAGFHLMTSWLAESLALVGRRDEASELFAGLCAAAGPTGVMAEELDPISGLALGNIPRAYSHVGLINTAIRLQP